MRVLLVSLPGARAALRLELARLGIDIAGEFPTLAAARRAALPHDAIVVAPDEEADDEWRAPGEALTSREREVLELLAEGLANKSIAERLGISDQTVKFHVAAICGKLGAANRTDAVRRAIRTGLVAV